MTLQERRIATGWKQTPPENTPRLRLKPKARACGYVDGAWWPHSDDLASELPDLLAVLSVRLGPIDRVIYNLAEWVTIPTKKVLIGGRLVRLAGYNRQPANTVEVIGVNRAKIVLLVVPACTDTDQAHGALMAAAAPNDESTIEELLTANASNR
jgi:hypothetical protein